jgi:lipopolysaccharide/colanic/teichoic acid biosynthesis glycosyltransferase
MRRIDPSPSQAVSLKDTFPFQPSVWPDPNQKGKASDLALPLPNPAELHVQPSSTYENESRVSAKNEIAGARDTPLWKYILDITCILLSLPIWLPILVGVALWIKIASPGPIFFRQERVGLRGRRFMILKFRTMKVNVETQSHERHLEQLIHADCPMTKLDSSGDPRIISGGRILRATGLDELPQLFNVLRREMSLVGPRPCTPHEFQRYQAWQQERVNAAPGLTGYWQVNGKNKTTFTEMIKMDIFYTKNMSFWLDVTIMLRTFPAIFMQLAESRLAKSTLRGARKPATGQC